MHSIPKVLDLGFHGKTQQKHHVTHCFDFKNGYRIPRPPLSGIGGQPLNEDSIAFQKSDHDPMLFDPILTYGRVKSTPIDRFRPNFVLNDKKTLKFQAFCKQQISRSPTENYRTRFVNIFYFLEDDTIIVIEPEIDNCGFPQGKLVRRGKITKVNGHQYYSWKDFNIGVDIEIQGFVFHIANCDRFTKDFLLSNGIELNPAECLSIGPGSNADYMFKKKKTPPTANDKLRRYLEYQGMVLEFDCVLNDSDGKTDGTLMTYKLFYYLEDDTIAIKELKENREGRYPFPMMVGRTKVPKNWPEHSAEFPSWCMEKTAVDVPSFYAPVDLRIGETVFIYSRKFLLLDCDKFTRNYYEHILKPPMPQPGKLEVATPEKAKCVKKLPQYLGLGTPEDSMASCYSLIPKSPRKDVINTLLNQNKYLRYGCVMDMEGEQERSFILMYSLADHKIKILEMASDNSGIQGGRFLSPTKLVKHGSNPNDPIYYTAKDLFIGATLHVFSHRFKITSADLYVYRYMQKMPEYFSSEQIKSVRDYLLLQGHLRGDECMETIEQEVTEHDEKLKEMETAGFKTVTFNEDP